MPQLYFYYSTMNAGKSTNLLQAAFNYREQGMTPLVYNAEIDDRFGKGKVASRIGLEEEANMFNIKTNLYEDIYRYHNEKKLDCILVDESQFLTKEQVHQLGEVVDKLNIPVLCYGIRTDFLGNLFEGSLHLLAWADKLIEIKTICFCGKKATMLVRLDQDGKVVKQGQQIDISDMDRYESLCRKHYKTKFNQ